MKPLIETPFLGTVKPSRLFPVVHNRGAGSRLFLSELLTPPNGREYRNQSKPTDGALFMNRPKYKIDEQSPEEFYPDFEISDPETDEPDKPIPFTLGNRTLVAGSDNGK